MLTTRLPTWALFTAAMLLPTCPAAYGQVAYISSATTNEVYQYTIPQTGTPTLTQTLTANLNSPAGLAFRSTGELFVVNRFTPGGTAGSVARFLNAASGSPTPNGVIADSNAPDGFDFNNPHGAAFRGDELFAPWGEMFVAEANNNALARVLFDGSGNPVPNGELTGNGLNGPSGLTFSPWGELFVGSNGGVSRWTFDASHVATANGSFTAPQVAGQIVFTPVPEPSALVTLGLTALGWVYCRIRRTARGASPS